MQLKNDETEANDSGTVLRTASFKVVMHAADELGFSEKGARRA
jgi:hypothetical protein